MASKFGKMSWVSDIAMPQMVVKYVAAFSRGSSIATKQNNKVNNVGISRRGSNNAFQQTVTRNIEIFSRLFKPAIQQNNYVYKQWLKDKPCVTFKMPLS